MRRSDHHRGTTAGRARHGRGPRRAAAAAVAAVLVALPTTGLPLTRDAVAATAAPVAELGVLAYPENRNAAFGTWNIVHFDERTERMYALYRAKDGTVWLAAYDTRPSVPVLAWTRHLHANGSAYYSSPYQTAIDAARGLLFLGDPVANTVGEVQQVTVVSLEDPTWPPATWHLTAQLPGFTLAGMTYSQADDRLYLLGETTRAVADFTPGFGRKPTSGVTTVAAFTPTGRFLWAYPTPECSQPLRTFGMGGLLARTSTHMAPTLLFACIAGGNGSGGNFAGQGGVVALRIRPDATGLDAAGFDTRFHPISGNYFNGSATGIAAFDPGSDRLFLQSLAARNPVAWVFDARSEAWVGSITAPRAENVWNGVNPRTGHYYMGGKVNGSSADTGHLLVADGRATPPHNGVLADPRLAPGGFIVADPYQDRIFAKHFLTDDIRVLRDLTSSAPDPIPPDYDAQTDDVPETPDTFVSFSGDADGFGSKVTLVGGTAGATSTAGSTASGSLESLAKSGVPVPSPNGGTRGLAFARVPGITVQPAGTAASAQASTADTNTAQELATQGAPTPWPHGTESCLDGGEGVDNPPERTRDGYAAVRCDLRAFVGQAVAEHTTAATQDVTVATSRYDGRVQRTAKDGMGTASSASASGVHLAVPGVGTLAIGRVTATSTTVAHGRRGTAAAAWKRVVEDVVVRDTTGKVVLSSPGCTTTVTHDGTAERRSGDDAACDELAEAVRKALQTRVRLFFPRPRVVATPKGAFAGIGQTDADYYNQFTVNDQGKVLDLDAPTRRTMPAVQLDVYNDSVERSRVVVQLAALENSSIFTVNASASDPDCATGGCVPGIDSEPGGTTAAEGPAMVGTDETYALGAGPSPVPSAAMTGGRQLVAPRGRTSPLDAGLVFVRRGFGQGSLMGAVVFLVAASAGGVLRRRRLVTSLGRARLSRSP